MSLKQSVEIRRYTDKEGISRIRDIVLKNVRFNYTYLTRPRPVEHLGDGKTYETNLIINDPDAWNTFAEAFNEVYENAVLTTWRGKRPALDKMNLPFYVPTPKDDGTWHEFEEGAIAVVKSKNKQAPSLFLKVDTPLKYADEGDVDAFYSGMIGDAVISFWAYDAQGRPKPGIRTFLNGVCKTDDGDPLIFIGNNYDFIGAFGDEDDVSSAFAEPIKPTAHAAAVEPEPEPEKPGLSDLLGKKAAPKPTPKAVLNPKANILEPNKTVEPIKAEVEEQPSNLLKSLLQKGLNK